MANNFYGAISLTGGGAGALDAIDGAALADLDAAFVQVLGGIYFYTLDDDSAAAEDSPNVISPDTNAGTKRWLLQRLFVAAGTASTPGLAYAADQDTGFFFGTNRIDFVMAAGAKWTAQAAILRSEGVGGALKQAGVSATVPGCTFTNDQDTGIGNAGADILSMIAGAVEGIRITEAAGVITVKSEGAITIDSNAANTASILNLENTAGNIDIFRTDATPEGAVTGSIGDIAVDSTNGIIYLKETGNGTNTGWELFQVGDVSAANVSIALGTGSPTVDQVQEYFDNTGSSGYFTGGALTDGGAGTLDVAAGEGFIRDSASDNAPLKSFKWSASSGIAVTDNTTQYVFVDEAGTISLNSDEFLEAQDLILLGVVTDDGGSIVSVFNLGVRLEESIGQAGRFMRRTHGVTRDNRRGGLIFGQSGDANRDVTMSTGHLWWGRTDYTLSAFDTSGADTFDTYSSSGLEASGASQWPNGQYDNAGTLTAITSNRWVNLYFYIIPNDVVVMVYGRNQYTSEALAAEEGVPSSSLPNIITTAGVLAARFTFQESANSATIASAFDITFAANGVTDHGNLAGLGDDDHTQYLLADGTRALAGAWDMGSQALTNVNIDSGVITGITDLAVADGGTGASDAPTALSNLGGTSGIILGTEQASTSGTAIDFTSIPAGTKKITIMLVGVSTDGTEELLIQLGDSGGVETSGYISTAQTGVSVASSTSGFILGTGGAAAQTFSGSIVLTLEDSTNFTWTCTANNRLTTGNVTIASGDKSLSAELDRVRITSTGTPDDFDAGAINIQYE